MINIDQISTYKAAFWYAVSTCSWTSSDDRSSSLSGSVLLMLLSISSYNATAWSWQLIPRKSFKIEKEITFYSELFILC